MKKSKLSTTLVTILVTLLLATTIIALASAQPVALQQNEGRPDVDQLEAQEVTDVHVYQDKDVPEGKPAIYIVMLEDLPLAFYDGSIDAFASTSTATTGNRKLDAAAPASVAYLNYLDGKQAQAIQSANEAVGRSLDIAYQYKAVLNGYAAEMTPAEAAIIARQPGVIRVEREIEYELQTDHGPAWMGADTIWDGSATGVATYGEGVIVGVIDTGIDPWNPSFADVGDDGYDHDNPWGAGTYVGVCDSTDASYDPTFPCNDKLIGAWGYATVNGGDPRDVDGHGSHTASTAAGNVVYNATIVTPSKTFTATQISGVAPHANIIAYAACCTSAALTAAKEQVVLDGVDVVNYSIGADSLTADPWASADAVSWLAVRDAGIFVATSAGNNGPGDATIGSPADLPWIMSVGASSHDRTFLNSITLDDGVNTPITLDGMSMTGSLTTPTKVVFAADYADPTNGISADDARLCADNIFPAGTFSGEIVVCERGVYGRVAKGETVAAGGAGGYILAQPDEFTGGPGSLAPDPHVIPAVHIDYYKYQEMLAYFAAAPGDVMGTIAGSTMDVADKYGNEMASFSSRGPNGGLLGDYPIPNVTAPGRGIWAAYHQGAGGDGDYTFNVIQGTSMSSPHVAGAGALMVALHPDWTPAQIQSALMGTANTAVTNDDGTNPATPFAMGAGHVDLEMASKAGLVLDVTTTEFEASDPREGGDPKELNLVGLGNDQCVGICSWTRTLESKAAITVTWTTSMTSTDGLLATVEPATFELAPGATQVVTITVDATGTTQDEWAFGMVDLASSEAGVPDFHFPVSVKSTTSSLPTIVEISTNRDAGSQMVNDMLALEITNMTLRSGLVKADSTTFQVEEDPTNTIPEGFFDDLGQVYWNTFDVPAGTVRVVQEILDTTSPDLDMAVGFDKNGNGQPDDDEIVCQSATGGAYEYCSILNPDPGTWWIIVLNWEASAVGAADDVELATAVISENDALTFDAPTTVPANTLFDMRLFWDEPTLMVGDHWYGYFDMGTDAGNAGNLGVVPVDLVRIQDDVVKTANVTNALPGDTVEFTITVNPNNWDQEIDYVLEDIIPDGLTYVNGSAQADIGSVVVVNNKLTWVGSLEIPSSTYNITTNATDLTCDTPFGGYRDIQTAHGFGTLAGLEGDTISWSFTSLGLNTDFYGEAIAGKPTFTDDGFVEFLTGNTGAAPWTNQDLPDPEAPNAIAAPYWRDMEIVYDAATNKGVTGVSYNGGVLWLVEFDDIQEWHNPANSLDMEIVAWYVADPLPAAAGGGYDMFYAYDNVSISDTVGTIGIENADGTVATQFAYDNFTPTDGLVVCLDLISTAVPVEITYQATVDANALGMDIVNTATHDINYPGTNAEEASVTIHIGIPYYLPIIAKP